jgi:hypothetical protein
MGDDGAVEAIYFLRALSLPNVAEPRLVFQASRDGRRAACRPTCMDDIFIVAEHVTIVLGLVLSCSTPLPYFGLLPYVGQAAINTIAKRGGTTHQP